MTVPDDAIERMFTAIHDRKASDNLHVYKQDGKCVIHNPGRGLKFTEDTFAHAFVAYAHAY